MLAVIDWNFADLGLIPSSRMDSQGNLQRVLPLSLSLSPCFMILAIDQN